MIFKIGVLKLLGILFVLFLPFSMSHASNDGTIDISYASVESGNNGRIDFKIKVVNISDATVSRVRVSSKQAKGRDLNVADLEPGEVSTINAYIYVQRSAEPETIIWDVDYRDNRGNRHSAQLR